MNTKEFRDAVQNASLATVRGGKPVLEQVCLRGSCVIGGGVDTYTRTVVDMPSMPEGTFYAKPVLAFLKAVRGDTLHWHGTTLVTDAGERFNFTLSDVDEYPVTPQPDPHPIAEVTREELSALLATVAVGEGRYAMDHLHLNTDGRLASTDGRRATYLYLRGTHTEPTILIPARAVKNALRLKQDTYTLHANAIGDRVLFTPGESDYPKLSAVIPMSAPAATIEILREDFEHSLKVAASGSELGNVKLADGRVSATDGSSSAALNCKEWGRSLAIGIHAAYLLDALAAQPKKSMVTLEIRETNSPVCIHGTARVKSIVMPVSLRD